MEYNKYLRLMTSDNLLLPESLEALKAKQQVLGITEEQHQAALKEIGLTNDLLAIMEKRGQSLLQYQDILANKLVAGITVDVLEELRSFRNSNNLTEDDHIFALRRLGWSLDDFERVCNSEPRALTEYKSFLHGSILDETLEFNLHAHEKYMQLRTKHGVTPAEHTKALEKIGLTPEQYDTKRLELMRGALAAAKSREDDANRVLNEAKQSATTVQKELKEFLATDSLESTLVEKRSALEAKEKILAPKKQKMRELQVRVSVVKEKTLKREQEITQFRADTELAERASHMGDGDRVRMLADIPKIKKEIAAKQVDTLRMKQALASGTISHIPPTDLELRFLEFHRLCLALKLSVQNHEISNILVEQLWEEARDMDREEWRSFLRTKLTPNAVEGHPKTRDPEKGLLDWLIDAITGA